MEGEELETTKLRGKVMRLEAEVDRLRRLLPRWNSTNTHWPPRYKPIAAVIADSNRVMTLQWWEFKGEWVNETTGGHWRDAHGDPLPEELPVEAVTHWMTLPVPLPPVPEDQPHAD